MIELTREQIEMVKGMVEVNQEAATDIPGYPEVIELVMTACDEVLSC